jgi:ATP-binding cassette subfamily B protein
MTARPSRSVWRLLDQRALAFFAGYYRGRMGRVVLFTLLASAQSLLLLPVLQLVRDAFDRAIPSGDVRGLTWIGVQIVLLRALGSVIGLILRSSMLKTIKGAVTELRHDLLTRLYSLSSTYFGHADLDRMQTRIVQDSERIDNLSNTILSGILPALFTSLALLIYLLVLDWQLVLLTATALPLLWLATRLSGWVVKRDVNAFQRAFEGFNKGVLFALRHMDLTRAKAYENEELRRQRLLNEELRRSGHTMAMSFAVHRQVHRTITGMVGILILVVGGAAVARGSMTLGEFITFSFAASLLNGYIDTLIGGIPEIIAGNESLVTLRALMTEGETEPYRGTKHPRLDGPIELRDVTFAYDDHIVLRDLSFSLEPGANVAIIGPNGAGKSTILNLLIGFLHPRRGAVLADGVSYDEIDIRELRRAIGVVSQHPTFFAGTVRQNIAYGCTDAPEQEILRCARLSLAADFIEELPNGYDTQIGEGGVLLSGGECQRLAIARALLGKPKILVLDEPTNHLDRGTIERFMGELTSQRDRPTLLIISHDPSVIDFADRVFRLDGGTLHPAGAARPRVIAAASDR